MNKGNRPLQIEGALHFQQPASTLIPQEEEGRFSHCLAASPANGNCCKSASEQGAVHHPELSFSSNGPSLKAPPPASSFYSVQ